MLGLSGCGGKGAASPDAWVSYAQLRGVPSVFLVRPDGSERHLLARRAFAPAISPDGKWVAFSRCEPCRGSDDDPDLYVMPTGGGAARLLGRRLLEAGWSPHSDRLVARGRTRLVSIDAASRRTTVLDRGWFLGWSFSPDGRRVAYGRSARIRGDVCAKDIDLYVQPVAGGSRLRLTTDGRSALPVWGPRTIAFAHFAPACLGMEEIWVVPPGGGSAHPLARFHRTATSGTFGLEPVDWQGPTLLGGIVTEWGDIPIDVDERTGDYRRIADRLYAVGLSRDGRSVLLFEGAAEEPYSVAVAPLGGRPMVLVRGDVGQPSWNG